MTMSSRPHSATIYDFAALARARDAMRGQPFKPAVAPAEPPRATDCGSGWYHEAAIEAERPRKA